MSTRLTLGGCRPEPMASYLKALGVLRIVAEQEDPTARGFWSEGAFAIASRLDRNDLVAFFSDGYRPTPIVAPWNGGSGFHAKDNRTAIEAIERSTYARFTAYRAAIEVCRRLLTRLAITEKPSPDEKASVLQHLRAELDDEALKWLDAAVALSKDGPSYPPLLGTGGNDGRLDFSNNQMQRLVELLVEASPASRERLLRAALFGEPAPGLERCAIGQFSPAAAGGANAGRGFARGSLVNPWDYVLLLEGALLFAASITRRAESSEPGTLVFPFSVRASGVGYASGSLADEADSRDEIWLPIWSRPTSLSELSALFVEGRAKVTGHAVRTGVDFARAVATLGVDRGIDAFVRYGFHVRNGLAYFATPLGHWRVARQKHVDLVAEIDPWLNRLRRFANDAPASARLVLRAIEEAILELSIRGDQASAIALLVALGQADGVLSRSRKRNDPRHPGPVPRLSPAWLDACDDGSIEMRLAAGLASQGLREHLVPIDLKHPQRWLATDDGRRIWIDGDLVASLLAVLQRRALDGERDLRPPSPRRYCSPSDVAAFIRHDTDDERLEALLRGLSLVDWNDISPTLQATPPGPLPPAAFAVLKLAHFRHLGAALRLPSTPGLLAHGAAGHCQRATELALRRLAGAGLRPMIHPLDEAPRATRRITAALAFPLAPADLHRLRERVTQSEEES